MKTIKIYLITLIAIAFINVNAQESNDNRPPREKWNLVTMEGTVTEVVKETRAITLMGRNGDHTTIIADESVERFDEITVDDVLTVDYWTYMMAEFRQPTLEELAEPLIIVADAGKAPEGMDPAAAVGAIVRAIVTIEILNRPYMLATVRGPAGNYMTIQMEDEELIQQLNIGQVLILTYAEAVVVSLTKVNK